MISLGLARLWRGRSLGRARKLSELQRAEERYRALLERRDALNAQAEGHWSERERLRGERSALQTRLQEARAAREALQQQIAAHKARRNELQSAAKAQIALRRQMGGQLSGGLEARVAEVEDEVRRLERRVETTHLTIPQERATLERLRKLREERGRLAGALATQQQAVGEYASLSASVDALFRQADAEHAEVLRLAKDSDQRHTAVMQVRAALAQLDGLIDKAHAAYLKAKAAADRYHQRAVELLGRIIETRHGPQEERTAQEREVEALNAATSRTLDDPGKLEEAVEDALSQLRNKGRLRLD